MKRREELHTRQNLAWRSPGQNIAYWSDAGRVDPELLKYKVHGNWWEVLQSINVLLLVTREYEHLVMAITKDDASTNISYVSLPHPSGIAVDRKANRVFIAGTRNPNQLYDFIPVHDFLRRDEIELNSSTDSTLFPVRSRFYPGCMYLHDLAILDGRLVGNSVGQNAVVQFYEDGGFERIWWPRCIETGSGPIFTRNLIQLNSIGAGKSVKDSYFSASSDKITKRRPGHRNYPVNQRGVVFNGKTREPVVRGLTRPHSVRLHRGKIWLDNSGYGEFGFLRDGQFMPITTLPGWTRGLAFINDVAFVGTSRVLPRFEAYAPGIDPRKSVCGLFAIDTKSGNILGSMVWPFGNQIFAIDWISRDAASGFPFRVGKKRSSEHETKLFYAFNPNTRKSWRSTF